MPHPTPTPRPGALPAAGLALACLLAGCGAGEQPAAVGYRHADGTLRILVPVCPDEEVTGAGLRTGAEEHPVAGVDIPAEGGAVDLAVGYPDGATAASDGLRLTVTTSRVEYRDLDVPPVNGKTPTDDHWFTTGTGAAVTRQQLLDSLDC